VEALLAAIRGLSSDFDGLSQAVADRVGLSTTDLLAIDLISRNGRVTAGQIADRLHMTSGAITGVIDRLERAGLAQRVPDRADRRRVLVVPTAKESEIRALYEPLVTALWTAAASYSEDELALLERFIGQVRQAVAETTQGIRSGEARYPNDVAN
jgi:DNA-binding MarR family transcriptional regulator